jgi:hypothetical protein
MFTPACSGGKGALYGAIIICVGAIASAPEQEYHVLSGHRSPQHLVMGTTIVVPIYAFVGAKRGVALPDFGSYLP